jgi:hypothetical protein
LIALARQALLPADDHVLAHMVFSSIPRFLGCVRASYRASYCLVKYTCQVRPVLILGHLNMRRKASAVIARLAG